MKVAKFGGSSLANAVQIKKVIEIIKADPERRCIVVSAPGKSLPDNTKVTDLLYNLASCSFETFSKKTASIIINRYRNIIQDLGLHINFTKWFDEAIDASNNLNPVFQKDFLASRGEYWMARILAKALGYEFIDAGRFITFDSNWALDIDKTQKQAEKISLREIAKTKGVVVPGFYGTDVFGKTKTLSRGGSDITGAIVALCVGASIYENWTDVSGVLKADPKIVENPITIPELTYAELRELAYTGANVLHYESIYPVERVGIPINVRNANFPEHSGTMIVPKKDPQTRDPNLIIGIAGRTGFTVIKIAKPMMNGEVGFLRLVCQIIEEHHISIEHIPGGIDTLSVVVKSSDLTPHLASILNAINVHCKPSSLNVEDSMALICVVSETMCKTPQIASRVCSAVAQRGINIRMINQGSSPINIIIGVAEEDYEAAIRAIYEEFIG